MNRILIVRLSSLGDIVHALPVLPALHEAFPDVEIDWLVDARYDGILEFVDGTSRIVLHLDSLPGTIIFMRKQRYDAAIDLQGLLKSAVLARATGAKRVIGFGARALREPTASWFYREHAAVPEGAHVIRKNLAVLGLLGVTDGGQLRFPLRVPESPVADRVVADAGTRAHGHFVLLNPGAGWPNKRWAPDRFGALASRILERFGLPSVVLWGNEERALADAVAAASNGAASVAPHTTLGDLLALSDRATLMVSGDTGPTHITAALGTPIVGLYGPTWPERNGPWHPDDEIVSRASSCVCHHKRRCQRPGQRTCLDDVSVDDVFHAVVRRLERVQSSKFKIQS